MAKTERSNSVVDNALFGDGGEGRKEEQEPSKEEVARRWREDKAGRTSAEDLRNRFRF